MRCVSVSGAGEGGNKLNFLTDFAERERFLCGKFVTLPRRESSFFFFYALVSGMEIRDTHSARSQAPTGGRAEGNMAFTSVPAEGHGFTCTDTFGFHPEVSGKS